jgi:hypothetical protein
MAYKWENGKVVRVSMPKKLSPENEKALEEYWRNTDTSNHPWKGMFERLNINIKIQNAKC